MKDDPLVTLFLVFAPFSLTAFGGGVSIISAIQHQVVDVHHWVTAEEFLSLFAISRAAPGPGSMLTTLLGWKVAGIPGALVTTVAMFVPSSILCIGAAMIWRRYRGKSWLTTLELAVAPIGAGLMLAGVVSLGELMSGGFVLIPIALISSAICFWRPAASPLLLIAGGAAANLAVVMAQS